VAGGRGEVPAPEIMKEHSTRRAGYQVLLTESLLTKLSITDTAPDLVHFQIFKIVPSNFSHVDTCGLDLHNERKSGHFEHFRYGQ